MGETEDKVQHKFDCVMLSITECRPQVLQKRDLVQNERF